MIKLKNLLDYSRSRFAAATSSVINNSNPNPKRIPCINVFVVPIAFQRLADPKETGKKFACHYVLYSPELNFLSNSPFKSVIGEALGLWRTGLFVIGRLYRYSWDYIFAYAGKTSIGNNIYKESDKLIWKWSCSAEEDFLRMLNTHSQFYRNLQIPVSKIQLIYPENLTKDALFVSPYQLATDYIEKIEQSSCDIQTQLENCLKHLGQTKDYFQEYSKRSRRAFLSTLPFYAFFSFAHQDVMLAINSLSGFDVRLDLSNLIGLPLAYNIIKWFSYNRCIKSINLINTINSSSASVQAELIPRIKDLESFEKSNEITLKQIESMKEAIDSVGIKLIRADYYALNEVQFDTTELSMIEFKTLAKLFKSHKIKLAPLKIFVEKSQQKLKIKERLLKDIQ